MKKALVSVLFSIGFSTALLACGSGSSTAGNGQWLQACAEGSTCGEDGVCVCGVCTRVCSSDAQCAEVGQLNSCTNDANGAMDAVCTAATKPVSGGFCLPECTSEEQCTSFGENFRCVDGHCVGAVCVASDVQCTTGMTEVCETAPSGCEVCECKPEANLKFYETCGDPVCGGHRASEVPACTSETVGAACSDAGVQCDPGNDCNSYIVCADSDPKMQPGGCPISRRAYKEDIHYLSDEELAQAKQALLAIPLATYKYRDAKDKRTNLGFIIEDVEPSAAVDSRRDQVDLYGYLSMAVATLKLQEERIRALEARLEASTETSAPLCEPGK